MGLALEGVGAVHMGWTTEYSMFHVLGGFCPLDRATTIRIFLESMVEAVEKFNVARRCQDSATIRAILIKKFNQTISSVTT